MSDSLADRAIKWIGKWKPEDLRQHSDKWADSVDTEGRKLAARNKRVTKVKIKGTFPHQSSKDPSDGEPVISLALLSESETHIETVHIHEDGTSSTLKERKAANKTK